MSQQPKTETDRLANVIQVLQMGQKTGRLIVERNDGLQFEQGIITLVNGKVVHATLNHLQGPEAFSKLNNWGPCRFAFSPESRPGPVSRLPALSVRPGAAQPPHASGEGKNGSQASGTAPLHRPASGSIYPQEHLYNHTTRNLEGAQQPAPTAWLSTPYRTRHIEEGMHLIEQMGLSRTHRRLFLLIDGGRTVKELIRLMAHDPEDVQRLLRDLERTGVIQT